MICTRKHTWGLKPYSVADRTFRAAARDLETASDPETWRRRATQKLPAIQKRGGGPVESFRGGGAVECADLICRGYGERRRGMGYGDRR